MSANSSSESVREDIVSKAISFLNNTASSPISKRVNFLEGVFNSQDVNYYYLLFVIL